MTAPTRITAEQAIEAPQTKLIADREFIGTFKAADATPSVANLKTFKAGNTVANNLTYFDDGQDGQPISILGDGFTTVVHDVTKLKTNTGANKLLAADKVYRFTRFSSIWVEDA